MTPEQMRRAAEILDSLTQQPGFGRCPDYAPLARLLREEADSQGWRDIATAPRDGTYILGYRANGEIARCRVIPRDDCEMWEFGNTSGAYELYPRIRPTHWRPLPPPPQGREG